MKSSLSLIYTVCRIFLYRSKIFPNFFTALYFLAMPHLLTKTAEQNSADKQKKQARIFGARKHEVHIFHPAELSLPAPAGQHLSPPFFSYQPHNPSPANFLPPVLAGRRLTHLQPPHPTPSSQLSSSFFYRQHPSGYFHHSSIFPFPIFNSNFLPSPISNSTSSVLLPLLQPAGQTRNVASRAGAACKAADGASEEPAFLFFLSFFIFFCFSLFSILSHLISLAPRLRRDAFIFLFIFSFSFYSDFLFLFFLCSFFLLFLSFYFCSYLCFLVFYFYFCFYFYLCLLYFFSLFFFLVFIFASSFLFFVFLFVLLFYPPYSNLFPHYPTARQPFIFSLPPPIFPIPSSHFPAAAKRKKISAKESTGERWPHGSERAAGGKAEGRNGVLRGMEKDMYTTREKIREKKKWAPPGAGWFPGWNFAERRALPPKAAGRERKGGRKGEKCVCFICLFFPLFFVHLYKHKK